MDQQTDPSREIAEKIIRDFTSNPQVSRAVGGPATQPSPTPGKGAGGPAKKK